MGDAELVWGSCKTEGDAPEGRSGHTANLIGGKIYVFGGNGKGCAKSGQFNDMHILDFSPPGGVRGQWTCVDATGDIPAGRWLHSASTVEKKIYVFGGIVNDRIRYGDTHVFDTESHVWEKLETNGTLPVPRGHHTGTFIPSLRKVAIIGGYGGSGRLFTDIDALDVDTNTWSPMPTQGAQPKPRFDHTTSLCRMDSERVASNRLIMFGGRDFEGTVDTMHSLDLDTMTWEQVKQGSSPARPMPVFSQCAEAVQSATSWKLFAFGGRRAPFEYSDQVFAIDTTKMSWFNPKVLTGNGVSTPEGRENSACVFDQKGGRLLFLGGWCDRWLMDCVSLDVAQIVGPSYAVLALTPELGPLSGGRELIVQGINFVVDSKAQVKFTNGVDEEVVDGVVLSSTEIQCTTASFEKFGAQQVEVKVSIGTEMFTVNRVHYTFYDDTHAPNCVAFGTGLLGCMAGKPAQFLLQAKDTKNLPRTSGTDDFHIELRRTIKGKVDKFGGSVVDHDTGLYSLKYIAPMPGSFSLAVTLNGSHIRGSPFAIEASDPWVTSSVDGPAPACGEARREARAGSNGYLTWMDSKGSETAVNMFNVADTVWEGAQMEGKPPPPAEGFSMSPVADRMLMFGGRDARESIPRDKVYALKKGEDGVAWTWSSLVADPAPQPRSHHAAAVSPQNHLVVSCGDFASATFDVWIGDTKEIDSLIKWSQLSLDWAGEGKKAATPRYSHNQVVIDKKLVVFGGIMLEQEEGQAAPPGSPTVTEDNYDDDFDDEAGDAQDDAVEEKADADAEQEGTNAEDEADREEAPEAEAEEAPKQYLNELVLVDLVTGHAEVRYPSGEVPAARANHQMEVIDGNVMVYGGDAGEENGEFDDMYAYDIAANEWRCVYSRKSAEGTVYKSFIHPQTNTLVSLDGGEGVWDQVLTLPLQPLLAVQPFLKGIQELVKVQLKEVEEFVTSRNKVLEIVVEDGQLAQLLRVMTALADVFDQADKLDLQLEQLAEATSYMEKEGVETEELHERLGNVTSMFGVMKKKSPQIKTGLRQFQDREGRRIKEEILKFGESMAEYKENFRTLPFFVFESGSAGAYACIKEQAKTLIGYTKQLDEHENLARLFECLETIKQPRSVITTCREELGLLKILWDTICMVTSYYDSWKAVSWDDIETDEFEDVNRRFKNELRTMDKRIRQDFKPFEGLRDMVNDMGVALPVVGDLRQECMRLRHWEGVKEVTGTDFDPTNVSVLNFKDILDMKLFEFVDDVGDIVDKAMKEEKIEKNLVMLDKAWSEMEFEYTQHNKSDVWLVRISEEAFDQLEDHQVLVQNMAASRFVKQFEKEVNTWQVHLATVAEVIQILSEIQRTWAYLEELFIGSEEVKRELPEDAERFVGIDRDVKEVLVQCGDEPNLVKRCNADGLFKKLESTQHLLELCEKSLFDFMEAKRRAFPRFYFVSTKDLLDILSNGNRPERVMEHIPKIFQAIQRIDLKDESDMKVGIGMYSPQEEYVEFSKPCPLNGKVEMWLHRTIDAMRESLRVVLKRSIEEYYSYKENKTRADFILDYPAQLAITACQTFWCTEVEKCFVDIKELDDKNALTTYMELQHVQLVELISRVRTKLTKSERCKVMCIITLDSHAREMVRNMVNANVTRRDAFGWQCQLKYRWDEAKDTSVINICDAEFDYAFEYLGNMPRLVITPLTDRIYITATQALHLVMGCAPAGPAGTGKTETTKDLASQIGVAVYVFNCSDQMDYRSMGDIFKGLASSGTWGCFDEFNRISPEVLSVCSVQFKSVLEGIKKKTGYFNFPGEEDLVLNSDVGAFITMNPGYLGRTELPEGLKALFRPVTVVVPDFELICENMLMAEGYEDAKILAHKFVILYQLNRDLLSKQLHYDWGLRAIKSVLVVAGGFKRAEPEVAELALLMRALRDFNIPKIPQVDMVVFMGLINDLFPNMDIPAKRNLQLEEVASKMTIDSGLQAQEEFILKISQLEELIAIRHCVMLLGQSGAGKSEVYKTLAKSWTEQGNKTTVRDINPKAIHVDEFYGVISLATREWKDGLMSCTMRDLSRIPDTNPKWIILDGDLDANWIESMNSVMDDNRLLTLASNERIPLLPHMRLIFELRDLHYATPATVSRAGILFISTGDQYKWYVESWIQGKDQFNEDQKELLRVLFEKYSDSCLDFLLKTVKFLSPTLDFNIIQSLCHMLDGVLVPENIPEGCTDKMIFELFFCFAAVWAFGGGLSVRDGEDYRHRFNRWWRQEWRPIKFPDQGLVFDYFADAESTRYLPWSDVVEVIDYNPETPVTSVTVPTQETTGLSFWLNTLTKNRVPCLLVGYSGCGKTAVIKGNLAKLDPDETIFTVINFNYFTDARMLQKMLEQPLEKKAGKNYGPPGQKRLIYFLDDLNMPKLDKYNTQTPIALTRQHMDYGHWYDLEKLQLKNIGNVQYIACMNPAAGSFEINPRLQRHFVTFGVGFPNSDSLTSIYSTFLSAVLKNFEGPVAERCSKLIGAGLELHSRACGTFRKTAIKFHYEFNIRHTTNMFQGVMVAKKEDCRTPERLVKLWLHEAERTYRDLLMTPEDGETYTQIAREVAKKYFPGDRDQDIFPSLNVYCYFAKGLTDKAYADIPTVDKLDELLDEALREYNENFAVMNLVLFEDAMRHICRISRIIETGHALLVGVGGSGKQSLSRLTSFIAGATVSMITISRGYSSNDLKNDIMAMYVKAGLKDEPITFMMTDSQITDEKFLVYINDLLASGDIPDLFPPEEKEGVVNGVRNEVKAAGIVDTNENCYEFFLSKVRQNLHMILCFSPVGDALRVRARRFPALVNNTVIDWFHAWPADALQSVSQRFLGEMDLGDESTKAAIIEFMPFSFVTVNDASAEFLRKLKRYNYTTPKSFLELIDLYKKMLENKREALLAQTDRLQQGLDKLQGTAKNVGELEEVLKVKAVEVEEKIATAEVLSEKVGREKEFCEKEGAAATIEAASCEKIQVEVTQKQADCERDLAAALPAVGKAMAALDTITKKDLVELKALKKPPAGVDDVMSAVLCLLSPPEGVVKDKSWSAAQKSMKDVGKFMESLFAFKGKVDQEEVNPANFKAVRPFLKDEGFDPEKIVRKSNAAAGLCGWVINIVIYYDIVSDVEPKKRMLAQAIEDLESANTRLADVKAKVAELEAKLAELEAHFAQVMKEKDETVAESARMAKKLEMAQRLIAALASENVRWSKGVGDLQKQYTLLPGDVLVSAAFVSYVGAFNNTFRSMLMNEHFMPYITEKNIPRSDVADPVKLLTDDAKIASWSNDGLPADPLSVENGCLVTTCVRWPLLIDPQMQGIVWIKTSQEKNNLLVTRLGVKGMLDRMERCIENGDAVLIENLQESIDAVLGPIIGRQFFKKARNLYVKLGDKEVEVHKDFRLFLHTKLSNPHFPPEIQAETTLVNFTVTEDGLEDQLLARVVKKERPDLEEQKADLMRQQNEFKIKLKEIEDSLLYQLATAEGDLTENIELIENLEESKRVSVEIAEKAEVAEKTEAEINETREGYRIVATRAALLFFMLTSLVRVHSLYMYSLTSFVTVFERAIDRTELSEDLPKRLQLLIETITYNVWHFTRRGLFEKHKLTICTQLLLLCLKKAGRVDAEELDYLMTGKSALDHPPVPDNIKNWMGDAMWARLHHLKTVPGFQDVLDDLNNPKSIKQWRAWVEEDKAEKADLPPKMEGKTPFQKMCIVRAMRPDRITDALTDWCHDNLGARYVDEPSFSMMEVFKETTPANPVFFVLFPGVNPYNDVELVGKELGYTEAEGNLRRISMGQGQEEVANQVMDDFREKGGWVFMDNVHLMSKWLPVLERRLEICAEDAHENFRAFLSAEPHPDPHAKNIPQSILESSIKIINMPPMTLKANMRRAYAQFSQKSLDETEGGPDKKNAAKSMVFSLCFFHSCLVGRHKFGAQGWSRKYGFNFGDLTISGNVISNYLNNNDFVPWNDVVYIIGEVMYGGHITDKWDRRVCASYLEECMKPEILLGHELETPEEREKAVMNLAPGFKCPDPSAGEYDYFVSYIEEKFPAEGPTLFGLHNNAEIGYLLASSDALFSDITDISGGGGGVGDEGGDDSGMSHIEELQNLLPPLFDEITLGQRATDRTPYVCVVLQEVERMNKLMTEIGRSLGELKLGLQGALNMSDAMDSLLEALKLGRVPANWSSIAYPSLKLLAAWFTDMILRVEQLDRWQEKLETPFVAWISGFFNPMAYITAILQATARQKNLPLDQMEVWTDITSVTETAKIEGYPEDGMYIHGCCMEGARWDMKKGVIAESFPKDLHPSVPIINVRAITYDNVDKTGIFDCPVFVTTQRGGTFTFVATLKTTVPVNQWVLAGVAMMMNDDIAG